MKNRFLQFGLYGFLAAFMFSCETKIETTTTETIDEGQIKTEIEAMENNFAAALNSGNAEGAAAYYAEDATSYSSSEGPDVGKQAIIESIKKDIAEMPKGAKIRFTTKEIHVSDDGSQVVETGTFSFSDSTATKVITGNFMGMFEKRDGKYVCVRDMSVIDKTK